MLFITFITFYYGYVYLNLYDCWWKEKRNAGPSKTLKNDEEKNINMNAHSLNVKRESKRGDKQEDQKGLLLILCKIFAYDF